ncbi:hypothetical protein SGLAU_16970 [Streptomyces glaucescens]|uniref:Uncharacterized protein n=1 Tax=Streptomyces glaucescens TaxID=1907 RepID=A0A089Z0I8_STRGA|nr:hypothetical protein SGLAU_16970 [Streptomyces glaucescens]
MNRTIKSRLPSVLLSVETELQTAHIERHSENFSRIQKHFAQAYSRASAYGEEQ